jgi:hypothetical protein
MRYSFMLLVLAGCAQFDREDQIQDLRILGARTEPAEIMYSPLLLMGAEAPFEVPVHVEVYAFDPRGGLVTTTLGFETDDGTQIDNFASNTFTTSAAEEPAGAIEGLSFETVFTADHLRAAVAAPSLFPSTPKITVDVENPEQSEIRSESAFKRLPLNVDLGDPNLPAQLKQAMTEPLGITLCDQAPAELIEGIADCYAPRAANVNPNLVGIDVDGVRYDPTKPIQVEAGQVLDVVPVVEDVEMYQVMIRDPQTSVIHVENKRENISCNWYATSGDPSDAQTTSDDLSITWTLPESPPNARDALVVVVLDQRGGTTVSRIDVEYR